MGVVFDMDGTLVDSLGVVIDCYRKTVREHDGTDRSPEEVVAAFSIGPARAMLSHMIGPQTADVAVARYHALLLERCGEIAPYPGIREAVATVAERLPVAVFTGADTRAANIILEATGLRSSFAAVVGGDLVARSKPAPDGVIEAAGRLGLAPAAVAYVGDGPADVATARACGALAIAAGWGHQHDPARDADVIAGSPADLVAVVLERAAAPTSP